MDPEDPKKATTGRRRMSPIIVLFALSGVLVLCGLLIFYNGVWSKAAPVLEARNWQSAEAKVLDIHLETTRSVDQGPKSSGKVTFIYDIRARYQFAVDVVEHTGERVGYRGPDNSNYHKEMEAMLREHLENGTPVTIWYNPARPEDSIIDRKMPWDMFILSIVGSILFLVIGLGLGFALYRYTLQA